MSPARTASTAADVRLSETEEEIFLSGVQALVRVVIDRMRTDRRAGRHTASFVSGYPGSPLGGFDREMQALPSHLSELHIVHQPGLNEELAATAVQGSQLAPTRPDRRFDGVVGYWYGKAPGVDRAADALRHANFAGTSPTGGAVAFVGDDPANKSSTLPSSSLGLLADLRMPTFTPGNVEQTLDAGFHAIELSRITGLWTSVRLVSAVADGTGLVRPRQWAVPLSPEGAPSLLARRSVMGLMVGPYSNRAEEMFDEKLNVAREYIVLNHLNRITASSDRDWLTVVSYGHSARILDQALVRLGLHGRPGIRLVELALPFPLDTAEIRQFCGGVETVLVVEDKSPLVETAVKAALYGTTGPPEILGRADRSGERLLPPSGTLSVEDIDAALRRVIGERMALPERPSPPERVRIQIPLTSEDPARTPFFCPGCPHTTGLQVPPGELVGAGIGCHGMVRMLPDERIGDVVSNTQMGGEGAQWIGLGPFVETGHFTQNLGDGTMFHSGYLAIRFAVAARANMTYKILYNSAVAMTGGQDAVGGRDVASLCASLLSEGVTRIAVSTDDLGRYRRRRLPAGVRLVDRTEIVAVQSQFAALAGVSVVIHDQECAAERRRRWKADPRQAPTHKVMINERVCEGCGDCSTKAACLSLEAVGTEFGPKTRINQASCNLDISCLQGDCPSFVKVLPARSRGDRRATAATRARPPTDLPSAHQDLEGEVVIRMPGVGGTGVVTVSQILGTAAKHDGLFVTGSDQTGLSQKSGPVVSDLRISSVGIPPVASPGEGETDVLIAMDPITAATPDTLARLSPDRTRVVGTLAVATPGSALFSEATTLIDVEHLRERIDARSAPGQSVWLDAGAITERLLGRRTAANVLLLGVAYQRGLIPVSPESIEAAIRLNGVAVEDNLSAFAFGRQFITDPSALMADQAERPDSQPLHPDLGATIQAIAPAGPLRQAVQVRSRELVEYQGVAYARRYLEVLSAMRQAERRAGDTSGRLTSAVAFQLHRVMAYKDEYEVARLLLLPEVQEQGERLGGPGARVVWLLHPPLLRALGRKHKIGMGPSTRPVMKVLSRAKRLRGTAMDPFGYTEVRRAERQLIEDYTGLCLEVAAQLEGMGVDTAVGLVEMVDRVRGYEEVKLRNLAVYRAELADALVRLRAHA